MTNLNTLRVNQVGHPGSLIAVLLPRTNTRRENEAKPGKGHDESRRSPSLAIKIAAEGDAKNSGEIGWKRAVPEKR